MNGQSSSNSKHNQTNEVDTPTTMPHYDFVLPSYNRDRRLSSTISTVIPDATFNTVSGDVSFSSAEQIPSSSEIENNTKENETRYTLEQMVSYRHGRHVDDKVLSRKVRRFYAKQDQIIDQLSTMHERHTCSTAHDERLERHKRWALILIKTTLVSNIILVIGKVFSAIVSKSLSIASSAIESTIDLMLNFAIWWANRAIRKKNPHLYPQGRTRLEPIIIIILSIVMCAASFQVIFEGVRSVIEDVNYFRNVSGYAYEKPPVDINPAAISVMVATIVIKVVLSILCYQIPTPTMSALAADHRNDVVATVVALVFGIIGSKAIDGEIKPRELSVIDPVGAIVISLYIIICWIPQVRLHIRNLTGYTAPSNFLQQLTWLAFHHSPLVHKIDAVRAYHFGTHFLVEIDVLLPYDLKLAEAVHVGIGLEQKIEALPEVERAFVHLNCEHMNTNSNSITVNQNQQIVPSINRRQHKIV
ncbi:unnamed protein product [Adineta steineri]|uniref:Cation efflux protein transmembrane domain-containing protein n=1 Tax=Adineta steineri TaxID=433720 RepID=A0A815ZFM3_9BILA|nr:unnamed protein product [Adineta steineri]CAF1316872.1 unnamed protein product [Adineta steineri]CAF1582638.1 unnamed protein product [Adineta steineri]CAF1582731.1 unnamed protein product [Adineta steineri]